MEAARQHTSVFVLSLLVAAFAANTPLLSSAVDSPKPRCHAVTIHNSSYPTAGLKVDFVHVLSKNSSNVDECIAMCCLEGAEKCQFAWKFQSNCLAVACLDVTKCSPETGSNQDMTYVSIAFPPESLVTTVAPISSATATPPTPGQQETAPTSTPAFLVTIKGDTDVVGSEATLSASLTKEPAYTYTYLWEQADGPSELAITDHGKKTITLHSLIRGVYTITLTVQRSDGESSWASVDLAVHDQSAENQPPVPIILPSPSVVLRLPANSVTLDASHSTDDLGMENLQFDWTLLKKPSSFKPKGPLPWVGPKLELFDLVTGVYRIRLGVADGDGAKSFAEANVTVLPEEDRPPIASAGVPVVVVQLPANEVFLMGNYSSDDKGIVHYSWIQTSGADVNLHGEHTSVLHVAHLQEGHYSFQLTVTDTAGQSSSEVVEVVVQTVPVGNVPYIRAGGNVSVFLPDTSVTLHGNASADATSFQWTQIRGPPNVKLQGLNSLHLMVSGLHTDGSNPTVYLFTFTARNRMNQEISDSAFVFLYSSITTPGSLPSLNLTQGVPNDVTITLPEDSVTLTTGFFDHGSVEALQYRWSRSDSSPAIGRVAHGSDTTPNLHLTGLTNGTYVFAMATANAAGQWSEKTKVTLHVRENPLSKVLVQVVISANAQMFTQADLIDVSAMLKATLNHAEIVVERVVDYPPNVMIEFYAISEAGAPMNATDVHSKLTENGASFSLSPQYMVLEVETAVCQNTCSGHGFCQPRTKKCVCNMFWVENPFKSRLGRRISNCDWSVFYIMLVTIGGTFAITCLLWLCCCCCIKSRNNARKRRVRYAILAHKDNEENLNMLPKGEYAAGYAQTSLMVSESEEEEIVFDAVKTKKSARKPPNGMVSHSAPAQQLPNRSESKSV